MSSGKCAAIVGLIAVGCIASITCPTSPKIPPSRKASHLDTAEHGDKRGGRAFVEGHGNTNIDLAELDKALLEKRGVPYKHADTQGSFGNTPQESPESSRSPTPELHRVRSTSSSSTLGTSTKAKQRKAAAESAAHGGPSGSGHHTT